MRRTWIDFDLATSDLSDSAFRVLVYLLLHANKDGDCWPNLATIAKDTNRSERSLDFVIRELKSKKMIESFRDGNLGKGQIRYHINLQPSATSCAGSNDDLAQNPVDLAQPVAPGTGGPSAKSGRPSAKSGKTWRNIPSDLAQNSVPPLTTPYICEQGIEQGIEQSSSSKSAGEARQSEVAAAALEPFESGLGSDLPEFRNAPRLQSQKIQFKHADLGDAKNDFNRILGISAEVIIRKIDQEMVDRGFVRWALLKSEPKDSPPAFFQHLVNAEWGDGKWVNPEIEKEQKVEKQRMEQEQKKTAEELGRAKNLMEMAQREFLKGRTNQAEVDEYTELYHSIKRRLQIC